jgi:hypothetical protein
MNIYIRIPASKIPDELRVKNSIKILAFLNAIRIFKDRNILKPFWHYCTIMVEDRVAHHYFGVIITYQFKIEETLLDPSTLSTLSIWDKRIYHITILA